MVFTKYWDVATKQHSSYTYLVGICKSNALKVLKDSLALGAVTVHAILNGLVADLPEGPARHINGQTRLRAPLDGPPQPAALGVCCTEAPPT